MSDYDAMRRVINHEANQDDDGGFFAKLGGIDPDPDDDGPTAKGLFQHMNINRNSYAYRYDPKITPKKSIIDHLIKSFMTIEAKRKRQPIVKVEKHSEWGDGKGAWAWDCRICLYTGYHNTWDLAYKSATHHAHNHHKGDQDV